MAGFVYFLRAPEHNRIKIGYTADSPGLRLRHIRATCPCEIEAVGLMDGTPETERAIHTRFVDSWWRGEWFDVTPELEAFIREHARPWSYPGVKFKRPLPISVPFGVDVPKPRLGPPSPAPTGPDEWGRKYLARMGKLDAWAESTSLTFGGVTMTAAEWAEHAAIGTRAVRMLWLRMNDPGRLTMSDRERIMICNEIAEEIASAV